MKVALFTWSGNRYQKSGMVDLFHQSSKQEKKQNSETLSGLYKLSSEHVTGSWSTEVLNYFPWPRYWVARPRPRCQASRPYQNIRVQDQDQDTKNVPRDHLETRTHLETSHPWMHRGAWLANCWQSPCLPWINEENMPCIDSVPSSVKDTAIVYVHRGPIKTRHQILVHNFAK